MKILLFIAAFLAVGSTNAASLVDGLTGRLLGDEGLGALLRGLPGYKQFQSVVGQVGNIATVDVTRILNTLLREVQHLLNQVLSLVDQETLGRILEVLGNVKVTDQFNNLIAPAGSVRKADLGGLLRSLLDSEQLRRIVNSLVYIATVDVTRILNTLLNEVQHLLGQILKLVDKDTLASILGFLGNIEKSNQIQ